jgi:sulfinoalanine decarboxylase/sulfinoalanine decarboxylase/aspartate 1-decarboxylase
MNNQDKSELLNALQQFNQISSKLLQEEHDNGVAPRISVEELFDKVDLSLGEEGLEEKEFTKAIQDLTLATPRTASNKFFNQLFGGRKAAAVLGDLLAVMLNNSMYTYKAAGAQVGAEKIAIRNILDIIGWDNQADGTIAPGGSMANFMALLMARDQIDRDTRFKGVQKRMRVYTSIESHYSTLKNAAFAGIGRDNVVLVSSDQSGKMDPDALVKEIENDLANGYHPTMVNATAGTTVLGVFDDLVQLSDICSKHNIWLHVDGAYCGAVIFSEKFKHLIKGLEKADSFCFNAHKMLGTPLSCSIIVSKDKKSLHDSFANDASYLYQTDQDEFNLGKISLQCGRRNDGLKLWALWKSVGRKGLEEMVDHQFHLADIARNYIRNNNDYVLYSADESISVCFNYKGIPAEQLCTLLYEHEELLVGFGSFNEDTFVRLITINTNNSEEDMVNFFTTLEEFVASNKALFKLSEAKA